MEYRQEAISDGTLDELALSLEYFSRSEITVYFDDVEVPEADSRWNWLGSTSATLQFTPAVPNGVEVAVVRRTAVDAMRHRFSAGALFQQDVLDENFEQLRRSRVENPVIVDVDASALPATAPPGLTGSYVQFVLNSIGAKLMDITTAITTEVTERVAAISATAATAANNLAAQVATYAGDAGATAVGFIQSLVGAVRRTVQDKLSETVSVLDFMTAAQIADARTGSPTLDHTAAINAAFGSSVFSRRTVTIPPGCSFRITAPIIIPCGASFTGGGSSSKIIADFGSWVGTDYRAVVVKSREGVNRFGDEYNQLIGQYSLFGINNASVVSIGLDFSTASMIAPASAVNFSFYGGTVRNVLVSGFDTAYNVEEAWNSTFSHIYSMYCRAGLRIHGKSVNLTFSEVRFTNFDNSHTSSVAATQGVDVRSKFTYLAGAEGRPEGIVFTPGCLIFGADTNVYVSQCLYFRISNSIVDGGSSYGIRIGTADNVVVEGCYLYVSEASSFGVAMDSVATSDSKVSLIRNHFVGSGAVGQIGVNAGVGVRTGVEINNNFFRGWARPIFLNNCYASQVIGNYGRGNTGEFIAVQSGCENTIIDQNTSDDAYAILICQPSTDPSLDIRNNYSPTTRTFARGKVTLLSGTTSIAIPSALHSGVERYLRAYTNVKVSGNIGNYWVTDPVSTSSTATLNCSVAPGANVTIYYEARAIPSSAL